MNASRTYGCPRTLSALVLALVLLGASACEQPKGPLIIVQVTPVLAAADTLQVMTVVGDGDPKVAQEVPDFALDKSAGKQYFTLGLRLPVGAAGKVVVAVAAVNKQTGCMLATGVAQTVASVIVDDSQPDQLNLTLTALAKPDCGQGLRRPRVLGIAAPSMGSVGGGDTVKVYGWGFVPGVQVSLGGQPAPMTTWSSPLELSFQVPTLSGQLGLVELTVTNADAAQSKDQRADLVAYLRQPTFSKATSYSCPERTANETSNSAAFTAQLDGKPGQDVLFGLDASGDLDSYVRICVYLANGDGTLKAPGLYDTSASSGKLLLGEFDAVSGPDLAFAGIDNTTTKVYVLRNTGNGTGTFNPLSAGATYSLTGLTDYIVLDAFAADVNNDGFSDILLLIEDDTTATTKHYVYTLMNNQSGGFTASRSLTLAAHDEYAMVVTDLDGDKLPDLALTYSDGLPLPRVDVFLNQGGTAFASGKSYGTYDVTTSDSLVLSALDLNGDGKTDLALADGYLANVGGGAFQKGTTYTFGLPIKLVDFNGDTVNDAIFNSGYSLSKSRAAADWLPPVLPPGVEIDFSTTSFADISGDGLTDIIDAPDLLSFRVLLNTTK